MRERLIGGTIGAVAIAMAVGVGSIAAVRQDKPCLHGPGETPEHVARRNQALAFTRHVNTQQARLIPKTKAYSSAGELMLTAPLPDGFEFKLSADGKSYSFSVVDKTDRCLFGFFSNDSGLIFQGRVIQ